MSHCNVILVYQKIVTFINEVFEVLNVLTEEGHTKCESVMSADSKPYLCILAITNFFRFAPMPRIVINVQLRIDSLLIEDLRSTAFLSLLYQAYFTLHIPPLNCKHRECVVYPVVFHIFRVTINTISVFNFDINTKY